MTDAMHQRIRHYSGDRGDKIETIWDDGLVLRALALWIEGHTTAEIGRRIGVTKSSITGLARRKDFPPRPSPIIRSGVVAPRKPRRIPVVQIPVVPLPTLAADMPPPLPKVTATEPVGRCQWPITNERSWKFCDKPVAHRKNLDGTLHWYPYCTTHCRICYQHWVARQASAA